VSEIILDIGSGSNARHMHKMLEEVSKRDKGTHEIIFKAQLFEDIPPNEPLSQGAFEDAYWYADELGYRVTASVFDTQSLGVLLEYDVPFIKIACRPSLYWLRDEIPTSIPVYMSIMNPEEEYRDDATYLLCIPHYPAEAALYRWRLGKPMNTRIAGLSDHTVGLELYNEIHPDKWEKHLKLPESTGPDAGAFAITPEELEAIL